IASLRSARSAASPCGGAGPGAVPSPFPPQPARTAAQTSAVRHGTRRCTAPSLAETAPPPGGITTPEEACCPPGREVAGGPGWAHREQPPHEEKKTHDHHHFHTPRRRRRRESRHWRAHPLPPDRGGDGRRAGRHRGHGEGGGGG